MDSKPDITIKHDDDMEAAAANVLKAIAVAGSYLIQFEKEDGSIVLQSVSADGYYKTPRAPKALELNRIATFGWDSPSFHIPTETPEQKPFVSTRRASGKHLRFAVPV